MMESSFVGQGVLEKRVSRRDVKPHPRWLESLTEIYGAEQLEQMLSYRTWGTMYHYLRVTKVHRQTAASTVNVGDLITIEVGGIGRTHEDAFRQGSEVLVFLEPGLVPSAVDAAPTFVPAPPYGLASFQRHTVDGNAECADVAVWAEAQQAVVSVLSEAERGSDENGRGVMLMREWESSRGESQYSFLTPKELIPSFEPDCSALPWESLLSEIELALQTSPPAAGE